MKEKERTKEKTEKKKGEDRWIGCRNFQNTRNSAAQERRKKNTFDSL